MVMMVMVDMVAVIVARGYGGYGGCGGCHHGCSVLLLDLFVVVVLAGVYEGFVRTCGIECTVLSGLLLVVVVGVDVFWGSWLWILCLWVCFLRLVVAEIVVVGVF